MPLVEEERARSAGRYLREKGIVIDKVISAPLKRTLETANYILEEMNVDLPIIQDLRLKEIDYGPDENMVEDHVIKRLGSLYLEKEGMDRKDLTEDRIVERGLSVIAQWNEKAVVPLGWNVDSNIMSGNTVVYANSTEENGFAAMPPKDVKADLIYLCSPNNPTGSVYTKAQLREWVDYALANNAVIIFDAAYEAFITEADLPRSIYLVEGAKKCAIEICSLSKTAGFTGTRCGYTIVPDELIQKDSKGSDVKIADLWNRRQGSKFNGVSYPVQRAAEAVFTPEGQKQTKATIAYYQENARIIAKTCDELGIKYTGGINSPYIWLKSPNGMGSWEFFDYLLNEIQVVGTPGAGFGANGDGWFRLTAFSTHELTAEAMERFKTLFKK